MRASARDYLAGLSAAQGAALGHADPLAYTEALQTSQHGVRGVMAPELAMLMDAYLEEDDA